MWDQFSRIIRSALSEKGVELTSEQVELMKLHAAEVLRQNETMNLTEIVRPEEMATKHFVDSLTCLYLVPPGASIVDVGTGAGFPGIPLRIVLPSINLTLLDSLAKRTAFLEKLVRAAGLDRVNIVTARSEDYGRGAGREMFDIAVARAVARLSVLAEYCLPLVKPGGLFIAMKGPAAKAEADEAGKAIDLLGGAIEAIDNVDLPLSGGERWLISIRKIGRTPEKYPRRAGTPSKKPL